MFHTSSHYLGKIGCVTGRCKKLKKGSVEQRQNNLGKTWRAEERWSRMGKEPFEHDSRKGRKEGKAVG